MDAGFCVTAIDNDRSRLKHNPAPHKILVEDAVIYIAQHGAQYAFIWTSPPCQDYCAGTRAMRAHGIPTGHKRLIPATRFALQRSGRPWLIENVEGAKAEMQEPLLLCGRMFGLKAGDVDGEPLILDRHRLFESNLLLTAPAHPEHGDEQVAGVYGGGRRAKRLPGDTLEDLAPRDRYEARYVRRGGYVPRSKAVQQQLLGIDWMTQQGLQLSIPPAYAEHLGAQVLAHLAQADLAA